MTVRTSAISTIPSFSTKLNILLLIIEVEATIALDPSRFVRMNKSLDLARPDTEAASRRVSDGRTAPQAGEQPAPDERRSNSKTALIMLALCMAVFLSALDVTVITTALPTIAAHFNTSVREYSWIGSAYVLASAATVPSSGKISDIFGRKPVLLVANIVFLIGSLICAAMVGKAVVMTVTSNAERKTAMHKASIIKAVLLLLRRSSGAGCSPAWGAVLPSDTRLDAASVSGRARSSDLFILTKRLGSRAIVASTSIIKRRIFSFVENSEF